MLLASLKQMERERERINSTLQPGIKGFRMWNSGEGVAYAVEGVAYSVKGCILPDSVGLVNPGRGFPPRDGERVSSLYSISVDIPTLRRGRERRRGRGGRERGKEREGGREEGRERERERECE